MSPADSWHASDLPRNLIDALDHFCDAFERQWRQASPGNRPTIETFLPQAPSQIPRQGVFRELLRGEIELRRQAGESPTVDEYQRRFPEFAAQIAAVIAHVTSGPLSPAYENTERLVGAQAVAAPREVLAEVTVRGAESPPDVPRQIGKYRAFRKLGGGGFGDVYLAHDPVADPDARSVVALKLLRDDRCADLEYRRAFVAEASKAQKLKHPNLVQVFDLDMNDGHPFFTQQFLAGGDVKVWAASAKRTPDEIVDLMIPVAEAVAYIHRKRLFHRDLKPANILLDLAGTPYVADFGLALGEAELRDREGKVEGTISFMAPEQLRGRTQFVDGRSDIWSLGVILYQLLTNRVPFGGVNPPKNQAEFVSHMRTAIEENDPEPLRNFVEVSRELDDICLKCLEKEKRHRFRTGDDLAEALRAYQDRRRGPKPAASPTPLPLPPQATPVVSPKGLRAFDAADHEFFLELLPGPRNRDGLPPVVQFWRKRLGPPRQLTAGERLENDASSRGLDVCVVYGPSGCGKSSLVGAGLLPMLDERDRLVAVTVEATAHDTEVRLLAGLRQALQEIGMSLPRELSLPDVCRKLQQEGAKGRKVLLVFDQFEQWLHGNPSLIGNQLVEALQHCNGDRFQALLLVRDDFWMPLSRLLDELAIPLREGENCAAVDLFDRDHARKVLTLFGRAYDRLPQGDNALTTDQQQFIDRAIDELSENERVVCVRLALFAELMRHRPWTMSEFLEVGGAHGIGVRFLEDKFGPHAPVAYRRHRGAAQRLLECLLPPAGSDLKGQMRTSEELAAAARGTTASDFRELLRILDADLKLITPTTPDSPTATADAPLGDRAPDGAEYYQLTHDYLVPALREWLTTELRRTPKGRATLRLRERSEAWNRQPSPRQLPTLLEWLSIRGVVPRRTWTADQTRMMSAAARRHLGRIGLNMAAVALLLLVVWYGRGRLQSQGLLNELQVAKTSELPRLAERIPAWKRWLTPLLEQTFGNTVSTTSVAGAAGANDSRPQTVVDSENDDSVRVGDDADSFHRRLHVALALCQTDSKTASWKFVLENLTRIPPEDLAVVRVMIAPRQDALVDELWTRLARARKDQPGAVLPLTCLLAAFSADDPRWSEHADEVARQLVDVRPTQFPTWLGYLNPIAASLNGPLLEQWRQDDPERTGTQHTQLLEALARFAARDAATLAGAAELSKPTELPALLGGAKSIADAFAARASERLESLNRAEPDALPEASQAPRLPPDVQLVEQLRSHAGFLDHGVGMVQRLPFDKFTTLHTALVGQGYRPVSVRPYLMGEETHVAAAWVRDGRASKVDLTLSAQQLTDAFDANAGQGWGLDDFARYGDKWAAVWSVSPTPTSPDEVRFYIDKPLDEHLALLDDWGTSEYARPDKPLFWIDKIDIRVPPAEPPLVTALWRRAVVSSDADATWETRISAVYGDLHPGLAQTDLRLSWIPPAQRSPLTLYRRSEATRLKREPNGRFTSDSTKVADIQADTEAALNAMSLGDFAAAFRTFERLMRVKTLADNPSLAGFRATVFLQLNALEKAKAEMARFEQLGPRDAGELQLLKLRLAVAEGDIAEAQELLSKLVPTDMARKDVALRKFVVAAALVARAAAKAADEPLATSLRAQAISALDELLRTGGLELPEEFVQNVDLDSLRSEPAFATLCKEFRLDRRLIGVWHHHPGVITRELRELAPEAHRFAAEQLRKEGFIPLCVNFTTTDEVATQFASSVWQRPAESQPERTQRARRSAGLVLALAHLGRIEPLRQGLDDRYGIEVRAYLLAGAPTVMPYETVAALMTSEVQAEPPPDKIRFVRNLTLLAGGYGSPAVATSGVGAGDLSAILQRVASGANNAGLRAAAEWCLRQWKIAPGPKTPAGPQATRSWSETSFNGHTLVLLEPPSSQLIGSPPQDLNRDISEILHHVAIPRKLWVADRETTIGQFEQFLNDPRVKKYYEAKPFSATRKRFATSADCPQMSVRLFDALRYCQWLSEKEGLPESEWCFPGIWDKNDGEYVLKDDYLGRGGYRPPTEVEFEFLCRGGSSLSRPYGDAPELLAAYAWFAANSRGVAHPVGLLKPNDFGVFDSLGNVNEWCLERYESYRTPRGSILSDKSERPLPLKGDTLFVIRGGAYSSAPSEVRCANRIRSNPGVNNPSVGFRIVRTANTAKIESAP